MSDARLECVSQAFNKVSGGAECVTLEELLGSYNASAHPRVKTREKPSGQVFDEFKAAITNKSADGKTINMTAWIDYYADLNACVPNEREDYYMEVVKGTWGFYLNPKIGFLKNERLSELEKMLFEKVRQRTIGTDNEGKTLRLKFAYVDTYDEGFVDIKQFRQALVELGCSFNDCETQALFNMYSQNNPRLNYYDLSEYFKDLGLQAQPNLNPAYKEYRKLPENALNQIRKELSNRGYFGISFLRKIFYRADKNGNGNLDRNEFTWCLKECNINLTKTDYEKIFRYFDSNNDNTVSFVEFIEALTSPLTERRKQAVKYAYDLLKQTDARLSKDVISKCFSPLKHPEIVAGYMTRNEVLREFLQLFGDLEDKGVTLDQWGAVFTDISSNFKTDEEFETYLKDLWGFTA